MDIIEKVNEIAMESLSPGPAAFWHRYLWDKIHSVHCAHSNRGLYGAKMALAPNMMIDEVHGKLSELRCGMNRFKPLMRPKC